MAFRFRVIRSAGGPTGPSACAFIPIADPDNRALTLLNFGLSEWITLDLPQGIADLISGAELRDALNGARLVPVFAENGKVAI